MPRDLLEPLPTDAKPGDPVQFLRPDISDQITRLLNAVRNMQGRGSIKVIRAEAGFVISDQ